MTIGFGVIASFRHPTTRPALPAVICWHLPGRIQMPFAWFACNGMNLERTTHDRIIMAMTVLNTAQTQSSTKAQGGLVS